MSQLAIDQLPDLCLRKIFRFLKVKDLARCRQVCRLFEFYADQRKTKELVVHGYYSHYGGNHENWYPTNRPVEWESAISRRAFESLQRSQHQMLEQLRFLWIDYFQATNSNLQLLNGLQQLLSLEVRTWYIVPDHAIPQAELTLPNLRVLSFFSMNECRVVLKTPSLQVLQCDKIRAIEFEYPETIKRLDCTYISNYEAIAQFKNLEELKCDGNVGVLDRIQPVISKHLKELNLRLNWAFFYKELFEMFRSSLVSFLTTSANSKCGEQLKIYLNDVRLIEAGQLEDFTFMKHPLNFHLKNFKLITGRRLDVTRINYNDLMNLVPELSSDFFEKFPLIQVVEATGRVDLDQLVWFLKHTDNLRDLKITKSHPNASLNFDFLLQLRSLCSFVTDLQVEGAFDLATKLFEQIASFQEFESKVPWDERIVIRRDRSAEDRFELSFCRIRNGFPEISSRRTKRRLINLPGHYEKRKARFYPPTRSSKRSKRVRTDRLF